MPSLLDLLAETMLFSGARGVGVPPIPVELDDGPFRSKKPKPQTFEETPFHLREETALYNEIWRFRWNPNNPGTFTEITINSRGMGMDYKMPVPVFDSLEVSRLQIVREDGEPPIDLKLERAHVIGAWHTRVGKIDARNYSLWRLETKLDASLVVAFGYQLAGDQVLPLSQEEIDDYGDDLMPPPGQPSRLRFIAGQQPSAFVCVGPSRYIVAVELVLCKERPDFVPGDLVGFARIQPHVLFWSNEPLAETQVSIVLERPAKAMTHGDSTMKEDIGQLLVADANDEHAISSATDVPIPYADVLYDYYTTDPYRRFRRRKRTATDHPMQEDGEVTMADARRPARELPDVVRRLTSEPKHRSVRKVARQGQFDNVHMAPRMRLEFVDYDSAPPEPRTFDDVVMINQCLHDCVHLHVRWSEFLDARNRAVDTRVLHGWSGDGPYTRAGSPQVPHNQTIFLSFPNKHSVRYRGLATQVEPGRVQVFFHHGCAYAVDAWPTLDATVLLASLLNAVQALAIINNEPYPESIPADWPGFYWRVRWAGTHADPQERLQCDDIEECML